MWTTRLPGTPARLPRRGSMGRRVCFRMWRRWRAPVPVTPVRTRACEAAIACSPLGEGTARASHSRGGIDDGLKHGLSIGGGRGDDTQDFGRRGLLLQRLVSALLS